MTGEDNTEKKTDEPFLARWARVKRDQTQTASPPIPASAAERVAVANASIDGHLQPKTAEEARAEPGLANSTEPAALPSLASLTPQSDFSPFMASNVDAQLRNQAMKKLFTDPHYNVMDRLDIYIDDYSIEIPLSIDVIRQMNISKTLGLFDDEEKSAEAPVGTAAETEAAVAPRGESAVLPSPSEIEASTVPPESEKEHNISKSVPATRQAD